MLDRGELDLVGDVLAAAAEVLFGFGVVLRWMLGLDMVRLGLGRLGRTHPYHTATLVRVVYGHHGEVDLLGQRVVLDSGADVVAGW